MQHLRLKDIARKKTNQHGAATLFVTIILLIGITLIALYAARVGILDQRISGNEYRHKEAFANAEAGLDQAASFLRQNPELHDVSTAGWNSCSGFTAVFPCDLEVGASTINPTHVYGTTAASTITSSVSTVSALPNSQAYLIKTNDTTAAVGLGNSADGTGTAIVQIEYGQTSLLTPGHIPPIMAPAIDLKGNFTVVPDPNGGGPGVPVSAWVNTSVTGPGAGSWQTCNHGDFQDSGVCMDTKTDTDEWGVCNCLAGEHISNASDINSDIVIDPSANFPSSPFEYIFNGATQAEVKARAESKGKVIASCASFGGPPTTVDGVLLSALSEPLVWVDGDCSFPANTILANRTTPIVLVVDGDLHATGNLDIYGIVVGLADFQLNGGVVFHGSAISEDSSKLTNGIYKQVYDESVLDAFAEGTLTTDISKVKYSWRDFTPQ